LRWLIVLDAVLALWLAASPLLFGCGRSRVAARVELLGAFCLVAALLAVLILASNQERFVTYNEWNYEFSVGPRWSYAVLLLGAVVVVVAAARRRTVLVRSAVDGLSADLAAAGVTEGSPS
jgi:hypothetical protein